MIQTLKYLLYIAIVSFMIVGCDALSSPTQSQTNYRSHTVQKGETVFSIAKKYNTTGKAIYALNPDARNGIQENGVLVIPAADIINSQSGAVRFVTHKVKRKETLFSISQQYNVSVEDIKRHNKQLYSTQLKKGEKLQIPIAVNNSGTETTTTTETTNSATSDTGKHVVKPKETKFGIARMYGISMAELTELNPNLGENLQIGTTLIVPSEKVTTEASVDTDRFSFYEVLPKEGFYRLKVKLGLTEEQIVALNPYAKDGLKEGMILKIPKENNTVSTEEVSTINLETRLSNKSKKRIAVMLPFLLNRAQGDSINNSEILQNERTMGIALDFYSGVLMATEFAKDNGISVELDVFDTEASASRVGSIIAQNNFKDIHAVIGPLRANNVEKAATALQRDDIPVFSPLSNRELKISTNVFQTLPSDELLENGMINWIKDHSAGKNIVVISDSKRSAQKQKIVQALPNAKTISPRDKGFLYVGDIDKHMARGTAENWVIVETTDPVLLSNVVTILNGMPQDYKVRMFTLDKSKTYDFDDISNMNLAKLNFTFPSVSRSYEYDEKDPFLISYKNKYGVLPNRYAVRGFDVTYDVLLRLASAEDMYDATSAEFETEYIENKFRYAKKIFKGYENKAMYILKYTPDLTFEVVE
ncbi:MAG: peptidoglycan-binding protein LysM [Flavobacteriaceae bacterium]|nr:peptidoglycan-binding protein LysM [Flavobacteriaceae bacterium]